MTVMTSKEFSRPDPEELLRRLQEQEACDARGRLKIFLGYAPRVGKSLRMFDEGRRRKLRGQDVVIGAIQTRGLEELKPVVGEFEIVGEPGILDVDAILRRHPQVCLIDELARDNPPGNRHEHRWQDVQEICASGINVVGAVNLQHVFEQMDAVERITERRALTSVPVSFIDTADELTIVDVPPEELARNGGGASNLTAAQLSELRELALLLAAQVVEEQLHRYMNAHGIRQSWGTQERILVCITPRSNARAMMESGARAMRRFHGQLMAVYVKQADLTGRPRKPLTRTVEFAKKLGAEVFILESDNAIAEILRFAHELPHHPALHRPHAAAGMEVLGRQSRRAVDSGNRGEMDVRLFPCAAN